MHNEERENFYYIICLTMISFLLYISVLIERVLTLYVMINTGEDITSVIGRFAVVLSVCFSTIILSCVRLYDSEHSGRMLVYRLNRLHLYSDIIVIMAGFMTGLFRYWLFVLYMILVGTGILYDTMINIFVILKPELCFSKFDRKKVRLHSYTARGYKRCMNTENK